MTTTQRQLLRWPGCWPSYPARADSMLVALAPAIIIAILIVKLL